MTFWISTIVDANDKSKTLRVYLTFWISTIVDSFWLVINEYVYLTFWISTIVDINQMAQNSKSLFDFLNFYYCRSAVQYHVVCASLFDFLNFYYCRSLLASLFEVIVYLTFWISTIVDNKSRLPDWAVYLTFWISTIVDSSFGVNACRRLFDFLNFYYCRLYPFLYPFALSIWLFEFLLL